MQTSSQGAFPNHRDFFTFNSQFLASLGDGRGRLFADLGQDFTRVKWWFACQQFIEGGADGVNVIGHRGLFPHGLLGAHVHERTGNASFVHGGLGEAVGDAAGNAEVGDFKPSLMVHHEVGRLEVAVDDFDIVVGVVEGLAKLADPRLQFLHLKHLGGAGEPQIGQRVARHVFHGDAGAIFVLEKVEKFDDVGMGKFQAAPGFTF